MPFKDVKYVILLDMIVYFTLKICPDQVKWVFLALMLGDKQIRMFPMGDIAR